MTMYTHTHTTKQNKLIFFLYCYTRKNDIQYEKYEILVTFVKYSIIYYHVIISSDINTV